MSVHTYNRHVSVPKLAKPQTLNTRDLITTYLGAMRACAEGLCRGERPGHTLQPTALVNEACARMLRADKMRWNSSSHFLRTMARTMRHILTDSARARNAQKRTGRLERVPLDEGLVISSKAANEIIALSNALDELERVDSVACEIVDLKYFGGFTNRETAEILGISEATVKAKWARARTWLYQRLAH